MWLWPIWYRPINKTTDQCHNQHTWVSGELVEDCDNNRRSLFITSDMSDRDTGSTDNIERISSSNAAE